MKSRERSAGDLPAANNHTRTTDPVRKLLLAHTWGTFAMEELKRMWHELLCPVLPVPEHLGLTVDHTLHKERCLQQALSLQHTPLLKNKLMTALLKRMLPKAWNRKSSCLGKVFRSLQQNSLSFYSGTSISTLKSKLFCFILNPE